MKTIFSFVIAFVIAAAGARSVDAHLLWLNVSDHDPAAGETVYVEIGFGHEYPRDEMVKPGRLEPVHAIGPDGGKIALEEVFPAFYKFTPSVEGAYRIMAAFKPGFVSKTVEGRKMGNKKTLDKVVSCFAYRMTAEAVVVCGNPDSRAVPESDEALRIELPKDPGELKQGDKIPVRVLFNGEPLAGAEIKAAVAAVETGAEDRRAFEGTTDSGGKALVELSSAGVRCLFASHKIPYEDPSVCDDQMYRSSLTFGF